MSEASRWDVIFGRSTLDTIVIASIEMDRCRCEERRRCDGLL